MEGAAAVRISNFNKVFFKFVPESDECDFEMMGFHSRSEKLWPKILI